MSTTTVLSPVKLAIPRFTRSVLVGANWLLSKLQPASGARASEPKPADRIKEAAALRDYAMRYAKHDPRFAEDLLAAADLHERAV